MAYHHGLSARCACARCGGALRSAIARLRRAYPRGPARVLRSDVSERIAAVNHRRYRVAIQFARGAVFVSLADIFAPLPVGAREERGSVRARASALRRWGIKGLTRREAGALRAETVSRLRARGYRVA